MSTNNKNMVSLIRKLTSEYCRSELDICINSQIAHGYNSCVLEKANEETINILAKAGFVSSKMEKGATFIICFA